MFLHSLPCASADFLVAGRSKIEMPKIKNTDYMLVFNQQEFDKVIENANIYGQKPNTKIDFSKEFVFVLIHPSKFISGIHFYDSLNAEVEDENTMKINQVERNCLIRKTKIPFITMAKMTVK